MQNHGPDGPITSEDVRGSVALPVHRSAPEVTDVIFDFSDLEDMRVQDLSVLLTARQVATEEDRTVWATGVPLHTWRTLHAMGLSGFFKPFPTSDVEKA